MPTDEDRNVPSCVVDDPIYYERLIRRKLALRARRWTTVELLTKEPSLERGWGRPSVHYPRDDHLARLDLHYLIEPLHELRTDRYGNDAQITSRRINASNTVRPAKRIVRKVGNTFRQGKKRANGDRCLARSDHVRFDREGLFLPSTSSLVHWNLHFVCDLRKKIMCHITKNVFCPICHLLFVHVRLNSITFDF